MQNDIKNRVMRLVLTGLITIIFISSNAQDLISTAGDFFKKPSGSISFTIGEPIIETVGDDNHILTQGFQQAERPVMTDISNLDDVEITVFPNPTSDIIKIEISEQRDLKYCLFDLSGASLQEGELSMVNTTLSLTKYLPSVYILKIYGTNLANKTFQIVKK